MLYPPWLQRDRLGPTGIDPERVLGVDPDEVDDALSVTDLAETAVYDVEERGYVRKVEVDEGMS